MSTTLSRQLAVQRSRAPAPSSRTVRKGKSSLLFERGEAADYDAKTIYHLGLSGLDELVASGARELESFRQPLFSISASETVRHLQDREVNAQLDKALDGFLLALGPYFLRRSAQKVLEYLVRQFEIHIHNADRLLSSALPYHDSELFIRIVRLPVATKGSRWQFLGSLKANSDPISRLQLVKICLAELSLLSTVAENATAQPNNTKVVTFFAVLASQVIAAASQGRRGSKKDIVNEKIVPMLLAPAVSAAREENFPELQRAGYIILAQLAKHANLSEKACKLAILSSIRAATAGTLAEAFQCVSIVLFFGPKDACIPVKTVSRLVRGFEAAQIVDALVTAFGKTPTSPAAVRFVTNLYLQLASGVVAADEEEKQGDEQVLKATKVLTRLQVLEACIQECAPADLTSVFMALAALTTSHAEAKDVLEAAEAAARALATRNPRDIDIVLADAEASESCAAFASACFANTSALVGSLPVNNLDAKDTTVRLALHHRSASVRSHALNRLSEAKPGVDGLDWSVMLDRVRDDDEEVASAALAVIKGALKRSEEPLRCDKVQSLLSSLEVAMNTAQKTVLVDSLGLFTHLKIAQGADESESRDDLFMDGLLVLVRGLYAKKTSSAALKALQAFCANNETCALSAPFSSMDKSLQLAPGAENAELFFRLCRRAEKVGRAQSCVALVSLLANGGVKPCYEQATTAVRVASLPCIWGHKGNHTEDTVKQLEDALTKIIKERTDETLVTSETFNTFASEIPQDIAFLITLLDAPQSGFEALQTNVLQVLLKERFGSCMLRTLLVIANGTVPKVSTTTQRRAIVLISAFVRAVTAQGSKRSFLEITPSLLTALSHPSSDGVRAAAAELAVAILEAGKSKSEYIGYSEGAVEPLSKKSSGPKSKAKDMVHLLQQIQENQDQFSNDAGTLERILRSYSDDTSKACLEAVLERIAIEIEAAEKEGPRTFHSAFYPTNAMSCALRSVVKSAPLSALGQTVCRIASLTVERDMGAVYLIATQRWTDAAATIDVDAVLGGLNVEYKVARQASIQMLQTAHVFSALSSKQRESAFDVLSSLVSGHGGAAQAERGLSNEAMTAIAKVPFGGKMLRKRLEKADQETLIPLVEAARARLFGEKDESVLVEIAIELCEPLFKLIKEGNPPLVVLVCLNRCFHVLLNAIKHQMVKASDRAIVNILSLVDVEIVVDCVVRALNATSRNAALELLTNCSLLFPSKAFLAVAPVLEAVNNTSQLSPYAFVVLEHLTRCVASAGTSVHAGDQRVDLVEIIMQFVNVCKRSTNSAQLVRLFELLVQSCPSHSEALGAVLLLVLECGLEDATDDAEESDGVNMEQQVWIASELFQRFSIPDQVQGMVHLMASLTQVLELEAESENDMETDEDEETSALLSLVVSKIHERSNIPENKFVLAEHVCKFATEQLGGKIFLRRLNSFPGSQVESSGLNGQNGFLGLLHHLHRQIHLCSPSDGDSNAHVERYVAVRVELFSVLDRISSLLSVPMFVAVLQELLEDDDPHVRRLAIRQLASKVERQHGRWRTEEVVIFLEMVHRLQVIVEKKKESAVNKQTALLSLDVLAQHLGADHPKPFATAFPGVVAVLSTIAEKLSKGADLQLASSAALCIGTFVTVLGNKALNQLPKVAKALLACADLTSTDEHQMVLTQSAASALFAVVSELTPFLSPYLQDLLVLVGRGDSENVPTLIAATSTRIGQQLAEGVEARLLIAPLRAVFIKFVENRELDAAAHVVDVLKLAIENWERPVLTKQLLPLSQFFAKALELRVLAIGDLTDREALTDLQVDLTTLEESLSECYQELVMHLSASQLKQSFGVLRDAFMGKVQLDTESDDVFAEIGTKRKADTNNEGDNQTGPTAVVDWVRQCKAATMYYLTTRLGEKLLSLSAPFVSQVVGPAVKDMHASLSGAEPLSEDEADSNADSGSESDEPARKSSKRTSGSSAKSAGAPGSADADLELRWLVEQRIVRERALSLLGTFFDNGNDSLLDDKSQATKLFGDVLDAILTSLDIDRVAIGEDKSATEENEEYYSEFLEVHLVPSLVKLAKAVSDDTCWQTLHHALLQFSKHADPIVRKGMLDTVQALFEEVGEPYIVLLADTLPTIAELMEDKEREVKNTAHRVAKKLQQLSGEDLTTFL